MQQALLQPTSSGLRPHSRCMLSRRHNSRACQTFALFKRLGKDQRSAKASGKELLEQLLSDSSDRRAIDTLIDALAARPVKFAPKQLAGGPWEVVYTRGPLLWQTLTNTGQGSQKGARLSKKAYQDFEPANSSVLNYGEIWGDKLFVTADGTFDILGESKQTPISIQANIKKGALHCFGRKLPLPIRGTGNVELLYTDGQAVRIFRSSSGSISVQVKQSLLSQN